MTTNSCLINPRRIIITSPITALLDERISTNHFDADRRLSEEEIVELVRLATQAPSAFNFQNWKFVAVSSTGAKQRLRGVAFGQEKVVDAAVTFIVCGTLAPHEGLAHSLQPAVDANVIDQAVFDSWVTMAKEMYAGNPQFQRDEAIRSASLGSMTLMIAAQGLGLASGPMIGFDPQGVSREFGLSDMEVPVILVTVGYPSPGNWPQKPRRPLREVLSFA